MLGLVILRDPITTDQQRQWQKASDLQTDYRLSRIAWKPYNACLDG
jgi:hypothetical protein